jgi:2-alkyl-3-oxoalkanoate reductase
MLFGGRAKIPGIFVPAKLEARCRPLRFSNAKIKQVLGWSPKYGLMEALQRSTADSPAAAQVNRQSMAPRAEVAA